jgi:hypothetical protein
MTDIILIRDVTAADHEQWLSLWKGCNAFYERSGPMALPPGGHGQHLGSPTGPWGTYACYDAAWWTLIGIGTAAALR